MNEASMTPTASAERPAPIEPNELKDTVGWETLGAPPRPAPAPEPATAIGPAGEAACRFGPLRMADGRVRFRLWAPDAAAEGQPIRLEIAGMAPVAMTDAGDGWYEAITACCDGAHYWFRLDDGTTVPDPASRAQAEDVHGASVLVPEHAYQWCHAYWRGRPWHHAVVYEMHVGLFGGYAGAAQELPRLAALGFTCVELMPVAEFPGGRNWGYDGVLPFAPECSYGTPDELRGLVDAAHGLGMMVLLDVVYNHFGPEGNYLHLYASPFFREDVRTPWGAAIDFRRDEVRAFFAENAAYWLDAFRFDGLRFDAVHAIVDEGWLDELARALRAARPDRQIHLVLENDDNDAALLSGDTVEPPAGGADSAIRAESAGVQPARCHAGYDAQWNDDAHHAMHVLLTGESDGYYHDYAEVRLTGNASIVVEGTEAPSPALLHLARCLTEGFAWQGEVSPMRSAQAEGNAVVRRGSPSRHLPASAFVFFLQNHDQTGNRAFGERLATLAAPDALRAAVTLQLLCPQVPLVFMGEECGATTPFLFFTSHPPELAEAVRSGRRREFATSAAFADTDKAARIPDPNAEATFAASRIAAGPDDPWGPLYRRLLTIRQRELVPRIARSRSAGVTVLGNAALAARWTLDDGAILTIWCNLGDAPVTLVDNERAAAVEGALLAESGPDVLTAVRAGNLPATTTVACIREVAS